MATTGEQKLNMYDKRPLTRSLFDANLIQYVESASRAVIAALFGQSGSLVPIGLAEGSSADEFDMVLASAEDDAIDLDGHVLNLTNTPFNVITDTPFENAVGIAYHVYVRHNRFPVGIEINPRNGDGEYELEEDGVGELGDATEIVDNGVTISVKLGNVMDDTFSQAGRTARVWLANPVSTSEAVAIQTATVFYETGGGSLSQGNWVAIPNLMGQGTSDHPTSEIPADYRTMVDGATVVKAPLAATEPHVFIGTITGAGTGVSAAYDVSAQFNFPGVTSNTLNVLQLARDLYATPSLDNDGLPNLGTPLETQISDIVGNLRVIFNPTDTWATIKAALESSDDGVYVFKPGTYTMAAAGAISITTDSPANKRIIGEGDVIIDTATNTSFMTLDDARTLNWSIENITFDGAATAAEDTSVVARTGAVGLATGIRWIGCKFEDIAVHRSSTYPVADWAFDDCTFEEVTTDKFSDEVYAWFEILYANRTAFRNCVFKQETSSANRIGIFNATSEPPNVETTTLSGELAFAGCVATIQANLENVSGNKQTRVGIIAPGNGRIEGCKLGCGVTATRVLNNQFVSPQISAGEGDYLLQVSEAKQANGNLFYSAQSRITYKVDDSKADTHNVGIVVGCVEAVGNKFPFGIGYEAVAALASSTQIGVLSVFVNCSTVKDNVIEDTFDASFVINVPAAPGTQVDAPDTSFVEYTTNAAFPALPRDIDTDGISVIGNKIRQMTTIEPNAATIPDDVGVFNLGNAGSAALVKLGALPSSIGAMMRIQGNIAWNLSGGNAKDAAVSGGGVNPTVNAGDSGHATILLISTLQAAFTNEGGIILSDNITSYPSTSDGGVGANGGTSGDPGIAAFLVNEDASNDLWSVVVANNNLRYPNIQNGRHAMVASFSDTFIGFVINGNSMFVDNGTTPFGSVISGLLWFSANAVKLRASITGNLFSAAAGTAAFTAAETTIVGGGTANAVVTAGNQLDLTA